MIRLSDLQWERIRHHFPEENIADGRPGRRPVSTRQVLEGTLWILNTGAQWHMLPQCYPTRPTPSTAANLPRIQIGLVQGDSSGAEGSVERPGKPALIVGLHVDEPWGSWSPLCCRDRVRVSCRNGRDPSQSLLASAKPNFREDEHARAGVPHLDYEGAVSRFNHAIFGSG